MNAVRRRNHRVNLRCLEWRKAGVLSSLALLMEDSQPYGFHRKEQRILLQRMDGTEDTFMHNGADEGGCVSMAKALSTGMLPVCVKWIGRRDGKFVAKFEDRPFAQNVRDNMYYLNMKEDPEAEIVLAIAAPSDGQQGDFHEADYPLEPELLSQMAGEINSLIDAGKRVYLLDVLCANGGSPLLLASVDAVRLAGYSAWNTATNAMGTILGQIRTDALAGKTNIQFRNERYMDDMLYESIIRLALDKELLEKGEDSYHLADKLAVEKMVNKHYQMLGKEPAYARIFEGIRSVGEGYMTFPWPRTFEIQAHNV